ncbi:heterokaryon incompatibility protein-domain-containing protein [Xylaria digitata]|nr:heterokaryon incompatibility protein-domain-containing protein [Xylaria digitata]
MLQLAPRVEISQNPVITRAYSAKGALTTKKETPTARLCQRCTDINVDDLLSRKKQQRGSAKPDCKIYVRLGYLDSQSFTSWCDLCRFFKSASPDSSLDTLLVFKDADKNHRFPDVVHARPFLPGLLVVATKDKYTSGEPCYQGGHPFCTVDPLNSGGRLIEPDRVDYSLLSGWINDCKASHAECSGQQFLPRNIINCKQRTIRSLQNHVPYVALSYVWGDSYIPIDEPDVTSSLPDKLPATIEDAIQVTLGLQYEYLWVDKYCIKQHGGDEKAQEIARMDEIYRGAEVVLIDAAGADPTLGLPGVSRPRSAQPHVSLKSHTLTSLLSYPVDVIHRSDWAKRGWTYQEGALAKRRLFFTNDQVYFECHIHGCMETLCQTAIHATGSGPVSAPSMFITGSYDIRGASGTALVKFYLNQYSKRSLRYSSDILNAFRGIFHTLENREVPTLHCGGVPILTNDLDKQVSKSAANWFGFLRGLCWYSPRSVAIRRPGFPSWSWTGWEYRECPTGIKLLELAFPVHCLLRKAYVSCSDRTIRDLLGFDGEADGEQAPFKDIPSQVSPCPGAIYMTGKVVTFRARVSGEDHGYCAGSVNGDFWFEHKNGASPSRKGCRKPWFTQCWDVGGYKSGCPQGYSSETDEGLALSAVMALGRGLDPNTAQHLSSRLLGGSIHGYERNETTGANVKLILQLLRPLQKEIDSLELSSSLLAGKYKAYERVGILQVEFWEFADYEASDWFLEAVEQDIVIV